MVEVATSFLEVKKENVIKTIYDLEVAGTNYFHIDVMDGQFVKNNTVDIMREYTEYIKQVANTKTEVHLMVKDIESYVKAYVDMEVNCITFHLESLKSENEILKIISYIKQNNIQVGLAISPNTNIEEVYKYLPYIHRVLIMTVEPGIYPINGADENSICATTVDFALTYFVVSGELERSGVPVNLLISDAGGMSVLTAWAAGKLSASTVAKFFEEQDIAGKIKNRKLIIPGKVAVLKGELEAKLPDWEIIVAPNEAVQLVKFLKDLK